jgi:acetyl-CoA carboxylase biotin carboxyl carrier protein
VSLTYSDIAEIIKLIDASTLDEVIVEVGDIKVEVRRRGAATTGFQPSSPSPAAAPLPAPVTPPPAVHVQPAAAPDAVTVGAGQEAVRSPMVGTFYRRPSPEEPAFVEVGSGVSVDSPLCMVEVMKLFTTIYAKRPGRVAQICAADAELVEYDQVLIVIDPI